MERIQKVDSASFEILKSKPVTLALFAIGTVSSSGWTKGALSAWFYIEPPEDGIQDFDFNAEPPTGIVLPVQTPIVSDPIILLDPRNYWGEGKPILGARIHARQNTIEIAFDDQGWIAAVSDLKGPILPWPWLRRWRKIGNSGGADPFPLESHSHAAIAGKRFTGLSQTGQFKEALDDAIASAKGALHTDYIDWRLFGVSGRNGGFILQDELSVTIEVL
ncbi:hypothetical protein [Methylocystis rosea]|uniref:Uncharacterized protein n=1 Tax=Methylocystis rosea TaxID=173366 RepID=A0A3G8M6N0_9HYPH|nr:hypothetical protein [Methylocystis rosea]AZG77551.1 hypothetical protein EHO51_12875 [Methylocystis rosea]